MKLPADQNAVYICRGHDHKKTSYGGPALVIPNAISDGRSGLLVNPEDPYDLVDKLRILLSDKDPRQRMGRAGKRIAERTLSDRQYVLNFQKMMDIVMDDAAPCSGLCFKGFAQVDLEFDR